MASDQNRRSAGNRLEGIQDIMNGKHEICRGLEDLREALRNLCCGNEYEAQINIVNGIHRIKEGLRDIRAGLREVRGLLDCEDKREIKEGIRIICRALKELCEVLKEICCGCRENAEENLVRAIRCIEKGLCKIENGLEDLFIC